MKRVSILCGLLAAIAVPAAAVAGFTANYQVSITNIGASGSVVGARKSNDSLQYIMCVDGEYAYCIARDSANIVQSCWSVDDHQRAVMRAVGPASSIYFEWAGDGHCSRVFVYNGSQYLQ
jgi:hypothetical protein